MTISIDHHASAIPPCSSRQVAVRAAKEWTRRQSALRREEWSAATLAFPMHKQEMAFKTWHAMLSENNVRSTVVVVLFAYMLWSECSGRIGVSNAISHPIWLCRYAVLLIGLTFLLTSIARPNIIRRHMQASVLGISILTVSAVFNELLYQQALHTDGALNILVLFMVTVTSLAHLRFIINTVLCSFVVIGYNLLRYQFAASLIPSKGHVVLGDSVTPFWGNTVLIIAVVVLLRLSFGMEIRDRDDFLLTALLAERRREKHEQISARLARRRKTKLLQKHGLALTNPTDEWNDEQEETNLGDNQESLDKVDASLSMSAASSSCRHRGSLSLQKKREKDISVLPSHRPRDLLTAAVPSSESTSSSDSCSDSSSSSSSTSSGSDSDGSDDGEMMNLLEVQQPSASSEAPTLDRKFSLHNVSGTLQKTVERLMFGGMAVQPVSTRPNLRHASGPQVVAADQDVFAAPTPRSRKFERMDTAHGLFNKQHVRHRSSPVASLDAMQQITMALQESGMDSMGALLQMLGSKAQQDKPRSEYELDGVERLPPWLLPYGGIKSGYRARFTLTMCWESLFRWHNETANVWTEFIPAALGIVACIVMFTCDPVYLSAPLTSRILVAIGLFGGTVMRPLLSGLAHLLYCQNQAAYVFWWGVDYCSIVGSMFCAALVNGRNAFECLPEQWTFFNISLIGLFLSTIMSVLYVSSSGVRTGSFLLFVLFSAGVPYWYAVRLWQTGEAQFAAPQEFFILWTACFVCFVIALTFKSSCFPECCVGTKCMSQGRNFDKSFSSHAFWHIFLNAGNAFAIPVWRSYLQFRSQQSCTAATIPLA